MKTFQSVRSHEAVVSSRVGVLCSETGAGSFPVLNETMKGCSVMRSVFRSVLVALLAVLALGAVAASGASAHEYFIEGKSMKALGLKEEAISGKGSNSAVLSGGTTIQVTCPVVKSSGTIKEGGAGTATVTLTECSVQKPANCTVEEPIVIEAPSGLVEVEGKLADEFTPLSSMLLKFHPVPGQTCALDELQAAGQITGLVASEAEQESGPLSPLGPQSQREHQA